jgi:ferrous-iron efflux pump FieF
MSSANEHSQTIQQQASPSGLMRAATYCSVGVAGILVCSKLVAWWLTDSVAVLSSLFDSGLDLGASLINMFAVAHALQPADREHRFGHGKAEALAGLAQSTFIAGSAIFLVIEAGRRLIEPRQLAHVDIGIAVMVLSIVMTLGLVLFQYFVVRRTASLAISADSMHYKGDLLANLAIIGALIMATKFGWIYADPVLGIMVAVYIVHGAYGIFRQSLDQLMDHELPDEQRALIRSIALRHDEVADVHDLRTRRSGLQSFIQLHIEMDGNMRLSRAHEVADAVELEILAEFPEAEVIIHQDPAGLEEEMSHFEPPSTG